MNLVQFIKARFLKYDNTTINSKIQRLTIRDEIEIIRNSWSLITSLKSKKNFEDSNTGMSWSNSYTEQPKRNQCPW